MPELRRRAFLKTAGVVSGASLISAGSTTVAGHAQPGASAFVARSVKSTTVFERGETDEYHTFRIPVLVRATDGTLLAFAQGRVDDPEDFGHIHLVLKRSADDGETWGPLQEVASDPPNRIANSSVVVDEITGRIHVFVVRTGGDVSGGDIADGTVSPQDAPRPFVLHSDDHGATWSQWREITDDVKLPQMRHYVGGPTHGIQLTHGPHAGRLLMPGNHTFSPATEDDPAVVGVHTIYSDDHGETWQLGGAPGAYDDGIVVPNETAVVEAEDGTLYFNTRDQRGVAPGNRATTTSSDGGTSFDGPFEIVPDLETPIVSGSLFQHNRCTDRSERIIFSGPWHPSSRERLTLWSSLDDTMSWHKSLVVYDGPAGYSDLTAIDADTLGVLYENGPRLANERPLTYHQRISLARVPLATLDRCVKPPTETPDASGNRNHAFVSGNPQHVDGKFGRALELAGDYIELPHESAIDVGDRPFTAALWFRTDAERQQRLLHAYNYGGSFPQWWIELVPNSGVLRARMRTDAATTTAQVTGDFIDGEWHHVAVRRGDQNVWSLYHNGERVAHAPADSGSLTTDALAGIRIGARIDGINHPFVGAVDEIYLFGWALNATQIRAIADSNTYPGSPTFHLPLEVVL